MTLGIVNINVCMISKVRIVKINWFVIMELVTTDFKHQCNLYTMCSLVMYLLLLVLTTQCTVKTEISIRNYQSLFLKLTQLA